MDAEERVYFNLFRMWPDGNVVVRQADADSLEFMLEDNPSKTHTLSATEATSVRLYLDRYEDAEFLRDSLNWQHVARIGRYGNPYRPPSPTRYVGIDGTRLSGTLLHISGGELLTLTGTDGYQWDRVASMVRRVDAPTLARVERRRPAWAISNRILFGLGAMVGSVAAVETEWLTGTPHPGDALSLAGLVATSWGIIQWAASRKTFPVSGQRDRLEEAVPGLVNYTAFQENAVPPELTEETTSGFPPLFPRDRTTVGSTWSPARHVSIGSAFLFARSAPESYTGTGFGLLPAERRQAPFLRVDISQDHSKRMAYGVEALASLPTSADENQVDYSGQFVTVYASWYAARPDYLSFTHRWFLSAGAGVMGGRLMSRAPVSFSRQIVGLDPSLEGVDTIGQQSAIVAGQLRLTAGYALDEDRLLELRVTGMVPPLSLDKKERTFISSTLYTLDAISMPIGVSLGFRKRFVRRR